jgi:DNA helicase II / ATP-dependent DNA helicase PcrA
MSGPLVFHHNHSLGEIDMGKFNIFSGEPIKTESTPICPICGSAMRKQVRRNDGEPFWGCITYPNCRGTRRYTEPITANKFTPSKYQTALFEWLVYGTGHAVVNAVAGSGKTVSCVQSLQYIPYAIAYQKHMIKRVVLSDLLPLLNQQQINDLMANTKVAFVAFNRHIARELSKKAPEYTHVSTLHSLGLANIKAALGDVKIEEYKVKHILDGILSLALTDHSINYTLLSDNATIIKRLVDLCKATLLEPTAENLDFLSDRYGIDTNGSAQDIYPVVERVFKESVAQRSIIDYEDMIYFCAVGIVPCEKFDFLFIDELQDLNKAQTEMVLRSINEHGRVVGVGDRAQSLYGFRAADVDAIPNIVKRLSAIELPLSITYRCPKSHVQLAQSLVPEIEASENAKEGVIEHINSYQMTKMVQTGDMVICRTNAPLVEPAFALIRNGVKAVIRGRDIGSGLLELLHKMQKKQSTYRLLDMIAGMIDYAGREIPKLIAAEKATKAQMLQDQIDTLVALADGCNSVGELENRIQTVFSDDNEGVVFSSVHRAKGLEAKRVFILRPDLMPHALAQQPWELQQEQNCMYVAYTRAKEALYFVGK